MTAEALTERTVAVGDGASQLVWEGGQGPALLWLHGIGGIDPARPLLERLTGRHTVLAPLSPGFSDLAELAEIDDVHDLAMYYDDLLDALALDRVVVAGHSFGAMVAAELAAHYPKRVTQLVLISPFGLWNDSYPVADLFALTPAEMPELLYANSSAMATAPRNRGEPDVEALVAVTQSMTTVAKFMWPIPDRGLARRLRRISAPTLVMFGQADAFVPPRYADDFVSAIPNSSSKLIAGAGHMVPVEDPDAALAAINDFLN